MKAAEIRELSADDLQAKLKEARAELFNLRFQMATSQLDNCLLYTSRARLTLPTASMRARMIPST